MVHKLLFIMSMVFSSMRGQALSEIHDNYESTQMNVKTTMSQRISRFQRYCSKYNSQNDLIYLITILFYQLCKERLMGKYYLKEEIHLFNKVNNNQHWKIDVFDIIS